MVVLAFRDSARPNNSSLMLINNAIVNCIRQPKAPRLDSVAYVF